MSMAYLKGMKLNEEAKEVLKNDVTNSVEKSIRGFGVDEDSALWRLYLTIP